MLALEILERVTTPDGAELTLCHRDGVYQIRLDGMELMSSRTHGSETALARWAAEALPAGARAPRVLVGGLGMGFTLRAALEAFPPGSRIQVAEIFPAVVRWNHGPLGPLAGHPLRDSRVEVLQKDIRLVLGDEAYDVILLDVDNGPDAFTVSSNEMLYTPRGLERLYRSLTPGGVLTVWSADPDPGYVRRLRRAGFEARASTTSARVGGKGPRHTLFVARRPSGASGSPRGQPSRRPGHRRG